MIKRLTVWQRIRNMLYQILKIRAERL